MSAVWILGGIAVLFLLALGGCVFAFVQAFGVPQSASGDPHVENETPLGKAANLLIDAAMALPFEDVWITAQDGVRLHGRYYETDPAAPLQILFHGYRGHPFRDFAGGLPLALDCGCNALLVDQRAHGQSGGRCLSFGILERQDCLCWIAFAQKRFGKDRPLILTGISMGAATVLMASELSLPPAVKGIIADSGYSSPRAIIRKVLSQTRYPTALTYQAVRLSGRLFGGFDIEAASAVQALTRATVPILFIHGEADTFVPCAMTAENAAATTSAHTVLTVPNADHGLSYMVDNAAYVCAVKAFLQKTV